MTVTGEDTDLQVNVTSFCLLMLLLLCEAFMESKEEELREQLMRGKEKRTFLFLFSSFLSSLLSFKGPK